MSGREKYEPISNQFDALINDDMGGDEYEAFLRENSGGDKKAGGKPELTKKKTFFRSVEAIAGIALAGAAVAGVGYGFATDNALKLKTETTGSVVDPGKAKVVEVNMTIPDITLSTATTETTGTKVAYEYRVRALNDFINFSPGSDTITRDAEVETEVKLSPGNVDIILDQEKDHLTFVVDEFALSTKVDIPTGKATTVKETGSLMKLPLEAFNELVKAIDGTFGSDGSKVPIIREIVNGNLTIHEGLERYADLNIVTGVDKKCTPLIAEIPDFEEELKINIKEVAKKELLEADNEIAILLNDRPLGEVNELVENADVEIPEFTIGPDEGNIQELEDYKKSEFFTNTKDSKQSISCGISKDMKLTREDGDSDG